MENFNLLGNRIKWALKRKELALDIRIKHIEIAKLFKPQLSRSAVSNWFNNKNGMDRKYSIVVGKYLDVNEIWLETGKGEPLIFDTPDYLNDKTVKIYSQDEVLYLFNRLSNDDQLRILDQMKRYIQAEPFRERRIGESVKIENDRRKKTA